MASRTISTRLAIEGESEYKRKVAEVNQSLKTMGTELSLVEAQYKSQANTREALLAKSDVLTRSYDKQGEKVAMTAEALTAAEVAQRKYAEAADAAAKGAVDIESKLSKLQKSTTGSAKEQNDLTKALEEYKRAQKDAETYQAAATKGVEQWTQKNNAAKAEQFELQRQLEATNRYLTEATVSADGCATSIDRYGKEAKQAGERSDEFGDKSAKAVEALASALAAAGVAKGIKAIATAIWECIEAGMSFESAFTGVFKTVEGSPEQLAAVSEGIKQMALEIPATVEEISAVAEAAGQLGIAREDVLSFTRTMIDLGESTNLTAEQGASDLAKFANVTRMAAADYERLGSTIVALGNSSATTEADIVAMGTRLASTGTLTGLTQAQIMGLSATLSSLGIEAEAGGTALAKLLKEFEVMVATGSPALNNFAQVAGMSAEEFSQKWGEDAVGALTAFISGLGRVDEAGGSSVAVLEQLGISEVRMSNAVLSLASSGDLLTTTLNTANQAWAENTALAEEAGKRYATTESQLAMLKNGFEGVKAAIGDALSPALRDVAKDGTEAMAWAADFIEQNPWLVHVFAGTVAGLGLLTAGVAGYTLVTKTAGIVTAAFSATLKSCPVVFVASAVIGLVTAIGLYAASAEDSNAKTRELVDSLRESRSAFEETTKGIEDNKTSTLAMVAALEEALAEEEKTAASKAVILELVGQLNEAVPNLALAYDAETDSLNMTTSALNSLIEAEAERQQQAENFQRLVELKKREKEIDAQLIEAEEALDTARKEGFDTAAGGIYVGTAYSTMVAGVAGKVLDAQRRFDDLTEEQRKNKEETERLTAEYDDYADSADNATEVAKKQKNQADVTTASQEELEKASKKLRDTTEVLTSAQDTLTTALKEQKEAGSLSLETALKLIDAGYASALTIDGETGAITLNKDTYIALAQAKIEEQIQAVETQRLSAISRVSLLNEAQAAVDAAIGYANKAKAEQLAEQTAKKRIGSIGNELAVYDAQIAALKASKNAIGSYTGAVAASARTSSSASKTVKTQAERDLADYKTLKDELDHQKAMGEIEEAAYYERLLALRDRYLTNAANKDEYRKVDEDYYKYKKSMADSAYKVAKADLEHEHTMGLKSDEEYYQALLKLRDEYLTEASDTDEYRRVTEDFYKYQTEQAEEAADARIKLIEQGVKDYETQMENMAAVAKNNLEEIQKAYDEVQAKQDAMNTKLGDYGDLFTMRNGFMDLSNLNEQIKAIEKYDQTLSKLKERGISGGLLDEVVGMGVDDATAYGDRLLKMSDKEWEKYNAAWEEKQRVARETAEKFYKEQTDALTKTYDDELGRFYDELGKSSFDAGAEAVGQLADGINAKRQEAIDAAADLVRELEAEFSAFGTASAAGGAWDQERMESMIAASIPTNLNPPQTESAQMGRLLSEVSLLREQSGRSSGPVGPIRLEAVLEMDGEVVSRKTFDYDLQQQKERGTSLVTR